MFVIVGGFVVAVLLAALIAPLFIDWTGYRASFEAEASKILGRPVKVAGAASARLIPFPSVTFDNVRVGEDTENPVLTAERFSMDAELAPFLSGEVLIFDMRVTSPKGVVTVQADGSIDWALRPASPFDPGQVRIENLVIENGQIDVVDAAAGTSHRISVPSATISARALIGPWRVNGDIAIDGEPLTLEGSTGQVSAEGVLPLRMRLFPNNRAFLVETDGSAKSEQGQLSYAGQFGIRPAAVTDPGKTRLRTTEADAAQGEGFRLSGTFDLASKALDLPELRLETGAKEDPYVANGAGSVTFGADPRFDLTFKGNQVTFDETTDRVTAGTGVANRINAIRDFVGTVPFPTMPGTVNVNLPAVVAGDTTIRDVAFAASPESGAWRVQGFRATLPGRTKLEAEGLLSRGDAFGFKGSLVAASTQPAGLANWLTGEVDPAVRNLAAAGFSGSADFTPDIQSLSNLELAIGDSILKGHAMRRADGERPAIDLKLTAGALDLASLGALGSALVDQDGESRFGGHDVALSLDAGPVTAGAFEAKALGLTVRIKQDRADIDRLMVTQAADASLSATGTVTGLPDHPAATIDATMVSVDGETFFGEAASHYPGIGWLGEIRDRVAATPGILKDMQLSVVAASAPEQGGRGWSLSGNVKTAAGSGSFAVNTKGDAADFSSLDGTVQASAELAEPLDLLSLAGVSLVPLGAPGPARLDFNGKGNLIDGFELESALSADGTTATLSGVATRIDGVPGFNGSVSLMSNDLDPYLTATGFALPGTGFGTPVTFSAAIARQGSAMRLNGVQATAGEATASGDLVVALGEPASIDGALALNRLDLVWLGEALAGAGTLGGDLSSLPDQPFATGASALPTGKLVIKADAIGLGPLGDASTGTLNLANTPEGLRLNNLQAALAGGNIGGNADISISEGSVSVTGDFKLAGAHLDALGVGPGMRGVADIAGSLSATGKSAEGLASALTGSGVLTLRDGVLDGINPDGLSALLAKAGEQEKAPSPAEAEQLVRSFLLAGPFSFGSSQLAWTAASGKVRVPAFHAVQGKAAVDAALEADIGQSVVEISGAIRFDAGAEALAGAETVVPFTLTGGSAGRVLIHDFQPMGQFLAQRALEREQARVEAMQSALVEKQRLRRDAAAIQIAYAERDRRALRLEEALRASARREAERLNGLWLEEMARRDAEAKAKAEAEAAAKKAAEAAAKAAQEIKPLPDFANPSAGAPLPQLDFQLNP